MCFLLLRVLRGRMLVLILLILFQVFFLRLRLLFGVNMRLRLLIFFVLLLYNLTVVDLEFFLVGLVGLCWSGLLSLSGHVKYLKHCIIVEMLKIERLKDYLAYNEIHELFLQLNFIEETSELLLRYSAFPVSLSIQCSKDVLMIVRHKLSNLDKHLLLFLLAHYFISLYKFGKIGQHLPFGQFFVFINLNFGTLGAFLLLETIKQLQ